MTPRLGWPASSLLSFLAAIATWVGMWSWSGFAEKPSGFLVPALGGCLLVAVTGALLRSARVAAVLVLLGQIVVVGLWLHHRWAAGAALGGWVPTPASLGEVGATMRDSFTAAQRWASPVPKSVPEFYPLLILVGTASAVLVDFLACGLRRVPLAGLPLLALYTAPVSMLDGSVSWWKFVAGALAFLFLLATEEAHRLARWGSQIADRNEVFDSQRTEVSTEAVWASARKIGFTATGLAVVLPIFVPSLGIALFDGNGPGKGDGDSVAISNPMVDMKRDLSRGADLDLLQITTAESDPSYLRLTVLDAFDGEAWRPSERNIPVTHRADHRLPRPPGLGADVSRTQVPYTITATADFKSRWLPTPYPVYSISADGDWRYDSDTFDFISAADDQTTADLTYRLQGLDVRPTAAGLAAAGPSSSQILADYATVPQNTPGSVRELARKVTESAPSSYEKAVRLQQWFRGDGGFTYSLDRSSGNSVDQLERFLGTGPGSRTGYCEQFAAAMALMGRAVGIPSRVAVGFLRPDRTGPETYVYSSHDLHAWPEMYFEGAGWVRFEPTPQARASSVPAYTRQQVPAANPSQAPTSASQAPRADRFDQPTTAPGTSAPGTKQSGSPVNGLLLVLAWVLVALAVLALPALTRVLVRRRRWSSAATPAAVAATAWLELRDTAVDLGLRWDDSVTVRTRAGGLLRAFGATNVDDARPTRSRALGAAANPQATDALDRLVRFIERARYGRPDTARLAPEAVTPVKDDVDLCVRALLHGASKGRRLRARWAPASLLTTLRSASRRRTEARTGVQAGVDHAV